MKYKRVLLKLSGESLGGKEQRGIDPDTLHEYVQEIKEVVSLGVSVGIVIGGGNIFRGLSGVGKGFDRVKGDHMGMLATVINALALQSALEAEGLKVHLLTAVTMGPVGERYSKHKMMDYLKRNEVVVFGFGTGNPFFTTDTASSLRAVEMEAEVLLKGTRVDGVYTADPEKDPSATRFDEITFDDTIEKNLKVMDLTAFSMCRDNNLPIVVFDMNKKGNLKKIILGEKIGTLIKN